MLHAEDVNGDGLMDVVLHFSIQALGLLATDGKLQLSGGTRDGRPVWGVADVTVIK